MAQSTDIVLDGAGYMLAPGSNAYRRTQDGIAEGRTGRTAIHDFFGGQLRPFQLERDRVWSGLAVGPAYNGQGVKPWGYRESGALPSGAVAPSATSTIRTALVDDYIFLTIDTRLYRLGPVGSTTWPGLTLQATLGAAPLDIACYNSQLLIARGSSADLLVTSDYPACTSYVAISAGERANRLAPYAGYAIWADARSGAPANQLRLIHGAGVDSRSLDTRIISMTLADGRAWAVTRSSLFSFNGRPRPVMVPNPAYTVGGTQPAQIPGQEWQGEWEPFFQHGAYTAPEDHTFLTAFGGRIYTNIGGFIGEFNPDGDRAGWRDTGLHYSRCYSATVAGGYLIAVIDDPAGNNQVWAWDGSGWWLLLDRGTTSTIIAAIAIAGIGRSDLMLLEAGTTAITLLRLTPRSPTLHAIPPGEATLVTPLIDAGERDKHKAWRKVGCLFADPRPPTTVSSDAVTVQLDYSTDHGASWATAASSTLAGNSFTTNQVTLEASIASAAAVSHFLMLRVRWSSLTDWAPTLVHAWTEFEMLDSPARRRKWTLTITAADQTIDRAGAPLAITGRQLINQLWADWQAGTTLPFRDIDYDAAPVTRNVRITGIEEHTERPADAGRWGQSLIKLVLVEV